MIPYSRIIMESDLREQPLADRLDKNLKKEFEKIYMECKGVAS
jgi:hypothetical protein